MNKYTNSTPKSHIKVFNNLQEYLIQQCGIRIFNACNLIHIIVIELHNIYNDIGSWFSIQQTLFNQGIPFYHIREIIQYLQMGGTLNNPIKGVI